MSSFKRLPVGVARHGRAESALAINRVDRKKYMLLSLSLLFVTLAVMAFRMITM